MPLRNEEEEELHHVGPGTPSGEVLRRYWLPVEISENLGGGRGNAFSGARNPLRVRVLGEDLVLFRDASGEPALLAEHCSHRGTSLYYGRVEDDCIRCLYHGWAYDREGRVVDTPAEPPDSNFKLTVKHPSYPCVEVAGLIFAYLGAPERQPLFPRYHQLFGENGLRVTGNGGRIQRSNVFLQTLDNVLDPWHSEISHGWYKGTPVVTTMHHGRNGEPTTPIRYDRTPWGARYVVLQSGERPGKYSYRETHAVFPVQRCNLTDGRSMKWSVPIDDHSTRWFAVDFYPFVEGKPSREALSAINDPSPSDARAVMSDDWVEQVGAWWNLGHPWRQGQIWEDEIDMGTQGRPERNNFPDWEKWHLATSDRGVMFIRQLWREQVERVRRGEDPLGVIRDPANDLLVHIPADRVTVDWEAGMRLFNLSPEERAAMVAEQWATRSRSGPVPV